MHRLHGRHCNAYRTRAKSRATRKPYHQHDNDGPDRLHESIFPLTDLSLTAVAAHSIALSVRFIDPYSLGGNAARQRGLIGDSAVAAPRPREAVQSTELHKALKRYCEILRQDCIRRGLGTRALILSMLGPFLIPVLDTPK